MLEEGKQYSFMLRVSYLNEGFIFASSPPITIVTEEPKLKVGPVTSSNPNPKSDSNPNTNPTSNPNHNLIFKVHIPGGSRKLSVSAPLELKVS